MSRYHLTSSVVARYSISSIGLPWVLTAAANGTPWPGARLITSGMVVWPTNVSPQRMNVKASTSWVRSGTLVGIQASSATISGEGGAKQSPRRGERRGRSLDSVFAAGKENPVAVWHNDREELYFFQSDVLE